MGDGLGWGNRGASVRFVAGAAVRRRPRPVSARIQQKCCKCDATQEEERRVIIALSKQHTGNWMYDRRSYGILKGVT